jgi:hypothetical protein
MAQLIIDVNQEGPEFDPSIDEEGNAIALSDPPSPADFDVDAAIARGEAEIAEIESEMASILSREALPIDREDNQRAIRLNENEHTLRLPQDGHFIPWACAADLGRVSVTQTYTYNNAEVTRRLRLRYPKEQRGAAVLEIQAPRDLYADDNPA